MNQATNIWSHRYTNTRAKTDANGCLCMRRYAGKNGGRGGTPFICADSPSACSQSLSGGMSLEEKVLETDPRDRVFTGSQNILTSSSGSDVSWAFCFLIMRT